MDTILLSAAVMMVAHVATTHFATHCSKCPALAGTRFKPKQGGTFPKTLTNLKQNDGEVISQSKTRASSATPMPSMALLLALNLATADGALTSHGVNWPRLNMKSIKSIPMCVITP